MRRQSQQTAGGECEISRKESRQRVAMLQKGKRGGKSLEHSVRGERPYKCHLPDCGRAFIQLSNLQQHLRKKNRPFHCNICGKGFATESSLRTHTSKVSHVCTKSDVQLANSLIRGAGN
ncbi:Zinc finger protein rotund [Acromyrmex echinatior]|uniref:Zinc finger protein rotund n=1 Tax=Acromyrmex echinatior TaxID=103372 RepID=F4W4M2_ACREC|nr:Zinc finger protein rotund [Acromyrmex echinatior]